VREALASVVCSSFFCCFLRLLGFCSSVLVTSPRWLIWFQFSLSTDFSASVEAPVAGLHAVTRPTFPARRGHQQFSLPCSSFLVKSSSLSLETSLTLGFSCGPLCRPVFPATHKSSAGRCFGPRRSLVSRLWFLPLVFHLPLQLFILVVSSELLCPGSPARWSCCSVGCQSSALIWFAGLVLLERRSRCRQFGNA
jgi:hypothetical protein